MAIVQLNLCLLAPPVEKWRRILLEQSFTAHVPMLMVASTFGLGSTCWSSRHCYQHKLEIVVVM